MHEGTTPSASPPVPARTPALLDALFANAPVGLAFWDRDLRYRRINAELAAMNGLPPEAHVGRRPSEVLAELGPALEDRFRRILGSGEAERDVRISGCTPAAPGVIRHWLASYFPVLDANETVGVAGIVVEVTGEREAAVRAEEARQRSAFVDAELRSLYSALPVGVAFLGPDLRYRRVNETLAGMNGRPVEEHVGATLEDIVGEHAPELERALRRVMDTREPLEFELTAAPAGTPAAVRAFEATYFPVLDPDGRLLGVGGVVRDVTERHELEAEQSRLLRDALTARAQAEAAQVRAEDAKEEAERARADAERARAEAERARERTALLAQAGRKMASTLDWEAALQAVVRSVVPAVADWSTLTVVEPGGRLRVVAVAHADPGREALAWDLVRRYPPDPAARTGIARVIRTGELSFEADLPPETVLATARDAEHARLLGALDIRHHAVAPLRTPAGILGALTFTLGDSGRRFAAQDLDLIASLAFRAALHIQNARLYTERSHIAQTLQASLRPRALPAIPGADVAARFLPAGDQNEVGGDFYDVFISGERVWTGIVGDVAGKGAEAAALTALARHTLRTASMLHDDPAANLALLNRVLLDDSPGSDFCTAFYTRLCPGDGGLDFRFSNAGHPAPLLLRRDGTVESVEAGRGPLLGALPDARWTEGILRLRPGELLLLYTDGVTEVHTRDVALGERELRRTLARHAGAPAEEVVAAVERRAVELQSGPPRDDIALVAFAPRPQLG